MTIQNKAPHNFPDEFCSLFTLGAPPILGRNLCQILSKNFSTGAHGRIYFDNDPVATIIRGKSGQPLNLLEKPNIESVFKHTGSPISFSGIGLLSHSATTYIEYLSSTKPASIFPNWRTWKEMGHTSPPAHEFMGKFFFNATGGSPGYFLPNYNSLDLPEDIRLALGQYLSSSGWVMARNIKAYHRSWHPKRFADLTFYRLWRSEHLDKKGFIESLLLLKRKFQFTNSDYYQNTFLYLERLMKKHDLTYSDVKLMCSDVDTPEIENYPSCLSSQHVDPALDIYHFMKKYLENRVGFYS